MTPSKPVSYLLLSCGVLLSATAQAEDITELAKELSSLRSEVESVSADLSDEKNALQDQLRTYARQKSELSLELDREHLRLQKLRLAVAQKKQEVEAQRQRFKDLVPIFDKTSASLKRYIEHSLPFRTDERLAELKKLSQSMNSGLLSPPNAIVRLWSMVEDELRMTRESGMFRQTVEVGGEEQLADVVRVGMVMLYFRTADDKVGYAYRKDGGWAYRTIDASSDAALVETLFENFKKHVRVGLFRLPNAITTEAL